MNQYEKDLWPIVARGVLGFFTTALGALLLLDLAVFLKFEFAVQWIYFAMFFGSLLWFIVVVTLLWEWKTNGRKHRRPYQFMAVEVVCTVALAVSATGFLFEVMKSYAIIVDTLITFAFLAIFVHFCRGKFSMQ